MFNLMHTYKAWSNNNTYRLVSNNRETDDITMLVENDLHGLSWYETRPKNYWIKLLLTNTTIIRKIAKLEGSKRVTIFEK